MFNTQTPSQFNRTRVGGTYTEAVNGVELTITNAADGAKIVARGGQSVTIPAGLIDGNSEWLRNAAAQL